MGRNSLLLLVCWPQWTGYLENSVNNPHFNPDRWLAYVNLASGLINLVRPSVVSARHSKKVMCRVQMYVAILSTLSFAHPTIVPFNVFTNPNGESFPETISSTQLDSALRMVDITLGQTTPSAQLNMPFQMVNVILALPHSSA